uniref:ARF like GTPase 10 n=1 Tax=Nothoprocta perdicaria TaxID=30464 RepID=A0A8C6Z0N5_NOTPE
MAPAGAFRHLALALGAAVAALGSLLCIAWKVYFHRGGTCAGWDGWWELGPEPPAALVWGWELRNVGLPCPAALCPVLQLDWRQVLVLGLDGAGKSSVLHYICSRTAKETMAPTQGFKSARLCTEGLEMELLEVGGNQNLRSYWPHYLSQAHVLVFVVDSVDRSRLVTARRELHALLAEEPRLPLVVLANKQVGVWRQFPQPRGQLQVPGQPLAMPWDRALLQPCPGVAVPASRPMQPCPPAGRQGTMPCSAWRRQREPLVCFIPLRGRTLPRSSLSHQGSRPNRAALLAAFPT